MDSHFKQIKTAAIIGIVPAFLEGILILAVEPQINSWLLLQAVLFWFTCGAIISLVDNGWPTIAGSVGLTIFLNLPWYIAESIVKDKIDHLIPLIIASTIQGFIIGALKQRLQHRSHKEHWRHCS